MKNDVFYVYPQIGRDTKGDIAADKSVAIPAKFLIVNGAPVVDPNPQGSMHVHLYTKLNSTGKIDESSIFANPHNYLIGPANYTPAEAQNFASSVNTDMAFADLAGGLNAATGVGVGEMLAAFMPGGEQDLQRGEAWGVPKGETSPAFTDGASWSFGYITQQVALPNEAAVVGAGGLNTGEHDGKAFLNWLSGGGSKPTQKLDGPMGMSKTDYAAFQQGLADARAAGFSGSPLDFYKQLRKHILGGSKSGSKTLFDHALAAGQAGMGGFAPVGRMAPPRAGATRRQSGSGGEAAGLHGQSAGSSAHDRALAASGQTQGAGGYKSVLAQAKAQAVLARQSREAAGNAAYLAPRASGLSNVAFAPIGAGGLGPAARFAAHAGWQDQPAALHPGETTDITVDALTPSHTESKTSSASSLPTLNEAAAAAPGQTDFTRALETYFFRQSRLHPAGGAAFNRYLSPLWAGLKLPG